MSETKTPAGTFVPYSPTVSRSFENVFLEVEHALMWGTQGEQCGIYVETTCELVNVRRRSVPGGRVIRVDNATDFFPFPELSQVPVHMGGLYHTSRPIPMSQCKRRIMCAISDGNWLRERTSSCATRIMSRPPAPMMSLMMTSRRRDCGPRHSIFWQEI